MMRSVVCWLLLAAVAHGQAFVPLGSSYDESSVAITGGTIDGTAIGGSTPAAGAFTSVTLSAFLEGAEQSSDPSAPSAAYRLWQSDGTGTGDDGDLYVSINDGSTTKTTLLYDFSAGAFAGGGGGGLAEGDLDDITSGVELGWLSSTDLVDNGDGGLIVRNDANSATLTLTTAGNLTAGGSITATTNATLGAAGVLSYSGGTEIVANGDGGLIVRNAADTARLTLDSSGNPTIAGTRYKINDSNGGLEFDSSGSYKIYKIGARVLMEVASTVGTRFQSNAITVPNNGAYTFSSTTSADATSDVFVYRDAANALALRNSTNAQTLNIYNTYTDASNYERVGLYFSGNRAYLATSAGGTGTDRGLTIDAADLNFSNLPTSDPSVAGQLWNDAGTLKVSAGP